MKGKIINFNPQKGFGFILGEDDKKYFFHIVNVVNPMELEVGYSVNFTSQENGKGLTAVDITVEVPLKRDKWLKIDNLRIKASEIKEYEIYEQERDDNEICFVIKITTYNSGIKKLFYCYYEYSYYSIYNGNEYDNRATAREKAQEEAYGWLHYIDEELENM